MTDDESEGEPIAVFASPHAPDWEWQALRVEREQPETVYYQRSASLIRHAQPSAKFSAERLLVHEGST